MAEKIELIVPDLGDFSDVEVIEILVSVGDTVAIEDSLVTLETDKAAMDVPSTHAGVIVSIDVGTGDKVSAGDKVVTIEATEDAADDIESTAIINPKAKLAETAAEPAAETPVSATTHKAYLVVIGSGPGGYTAAFRAANLGLQVILVERYAALGGVFDAKDGIVRQTGA